ncbi:MAG: L,D-transpeptidase family protein [Gemmatimonadota bacterium]
MKTRRMQVRGLFALLVLFTSIIGCQKPLSDEDLRAAILAAVDSSLAPPQVSPTQWALIQAVYRDRKYHPLWVGFDHAEAKGQELIATLTEAESEGLRAADYDLPGLKAALLHAYNPKLDRDSIPGAVSALDLRLTSTFLLYGTHLFSGRLDPSAVDSGWFIKERRTGADSLLRHALREASFKATLSELLPRQAQYGQLVEALREYRSIAARGGWTRIPIRPRIKLKPNESDSIIPMIRRRLAATGELPAAQVNGSPIFDSILVAAVMRFQEVHGLETDSLIGAGTLEAMNVPVDQRIGQIELNMERYRWLPDDLGSRYILVNIPDYHLHAFDGGKEVFTMRVVVGKDFDNPTPVFADSMSYLVFRPYWNVPPRIIKEEIIPLTRKDPSYITKHDYEILRGRELVDPASIDWAKVDTAHFHYQIRQKPGSLNSLGLVKFMFPNQFDVYLHDTPARSLFRRAGRAASHGCIRVEKPEQLAQFALSQNPEWDQKKIHEAMTAKEELPQQVGLRQKVPVYIVYFTAFVQDGVPRFRRDLYGTDARAIARMRDGYITGGNQQLAIDLRKLAGTGRAN